MDKVKTVKVLQALDERLFEICGEVDSYVETIFNWADELEQIFETHSSTVNEEFPFQLPKTPCERKLRSRKTKNTLVSKVSHLNVVKLPNDITNMDLSVSSRTRSSRRVLTSKMSQFNIPTAEKPDIKLELIQSEKNNKTNVTVDTSSLPPTRSTKTKPVRKKQQVEEVQGESNSDEGSSTPKMVPIMGEVSVEAQKRKSSRLSPIKSPLQRHNSKKLCGILSVTPGKRQSRSTLSRTHSHSPLRQSYKNDGSEVQRAESTPGPSNATAVGEPIRRKISRALSESPIQRPSKYSKTFIKSSVKDLSNNTAQKDSTHVLESSRLEEVGTKIFEVPNESPMLRPSTSKTFTKSLVNDISKISRIPELPCSTPTPITQSTRIVTPSGTPDVVDTIEKSPLTRSKKNSTLIQKDESQTENTEKTRLISNKTVTIAKEEKSPATFLFEDPEVDEKKTPRILREKFSEVGKTSTPRPEKTPMLKGGPDDAEEELPTLKTEKADTVLETDDSFHSFQSDKNVTEVEEDECILPKKKKKGKMEVSEGKPAEEPVENIRITRTKSKALKEKLKQDAKAEVKQQQDFSEFAKKLANKAKQSAQKKKQLTALGENIATPNHGPQFYGFPTGLRSSKNKNHLVMLSSTKKRPKTPLATLPNSIAKKMQPGLMKRDSQVHSATKAKIDEMKLRKKKDKEDEVAKKRQKVIQSKKEELKRRNELKHQHATKQREKLEQEKYNNMIQSEKEKEERHKIILQERQMKLKEEAFKKKMLTQQKIAETVERRRLEEEARIAKLKEMEAEEQRIALEKQKEQERQEKREQERLALKKAREEYEMQMKRELELEKLKAEKAGTATKKVTDFLASASKMHSACKKQRFGIVGDSKKDWDYKPRHENDYGLEDEHSEAESDEERDIVVRRPVPPWAKRVMTLRNPMLNAITLEMLGEYMYCPQKSPDILKMFNMTPTKRIKRTSSAIWNTPTS